MNILSKEIFQNCIDVVEVNNMVYPVRFTKKQLDFYKAYNEISIMRSYSPAGIYMKGKTNSKYVKIKFAIEKAKPTESAYFDLLVNDVLVESSCGDLLKDGEIQTIIFDLAKYLNNEKEIDITIYLPHSVMVSFEEISISENTYFYKTSNRDKKLMCVGDSITQGLHAKHPSSTYPVLLSNYFNMELLNGALAGFIFDEGSLDENLKYKPDILTVAYGTNDWNMDYTINEFEEKCYKYLKKLKTIYNDSKIYVITPIWRLNPDANNKAGTLFDFIDTIKNVCNTLQLEVINGFELIPNMCEFYGDERLHPNDEGFLHMALNLSRKINLNQVKL